MELNSTEVTGNYKILEDTACGQCEHMSQIDSYAFICDIDGESVKEISFSCPKFEIANF